MASSVKDRFLGANGTALIGHAPDSGGTWSASSGLAGSSALIVAGSPNRVRNNVAAGFSVIKSNWVPASADYVGYFDIYAASATGQSGCFARLTAGNLGYACYWNTVNLYIAKLAANGGMTNLVQVATPITAGTSKLVRFGLAGTTLTADTQNAATGAWTNVLSVVDATYTLAGSVGFWGFGTMTDTTGVHIQNFLFLDGAATDMLIQPAALGGAGNATLNLRGYNTAWTPGSPGLPAIGIANAGSAATLVSQTMIAANLGSVVVNSGLSAGTLTLNDGPDSSTSTVAASTSVVINPLTDIQSGTPHISAFGKWTTSTVGASNAIVPAQIPAWQTSYQDFAFEFVALANQVTMLCNIPNGLTLRLAIDGGAPSAVVGTGVDTTITLYSIADGNAHLVRLTPPAGAKLSDLTLSGAAPALVSVAVTQAFFESNIAGMQLPAVASPVGVHGTFYIDGAARAGTSGLLCPVGGSGGASAYNGGICEVQSTASDVDVLADVVSAISQLQATINGVVPTLANVTNQGDGTLTAATKHYFPLSFSAAVNPNTVRVVNIGAGAGTPSKLWSMRGRTQGTTCNFLAAGGTALSIVSTANMVAGDWLLIGTDSTAEAVQVGSVTDATHISLIGGLTASGLAHNHASGQRVVRFAAPAATFTPWVSGAYSFAVGIWGDSISAGAQRLVVYTASQYDPTNMYGYRLGWPLGWNTIPLGVPGNHSFDLITRLYGGSTRTGNRWNGDGTLAAGDTPLYTPAPLDRVIILIGTNDCTLGTSTADFQANMQGVILAATDPTVLKSYAAGGRVLLCVPFSPMANNTDPGIGGAVNGAGLHVGINNWAADNTNYGYWLNQAIVASGVNAGKFGFVQAVAVSGTLTLGSTGAPGVDMHDDLHPSETGHAKIGVALGALIALAAGFNARLISAGFGQRVFFVDADGLLQANGGQIAA